MTNITPTTPQAWTKNNLEKALNTAIAVELFTIPVYLSAATSIVKANRADKTIPVTIKGDTSGTTKVETFSAFNVIMSVAVQEMFHLTLACNLCNALGFRPNLMAPDLANPPSCLSGIIGMPVKGNLSDLIATMVAIEKPDQKYDEPPSDPLSPVGPTEYQEEYASIGDLYHALAYGVDKYWNYDKANDAYQKTNFEGKYANINQVIKTKEDALIAMACITEQGEGIGVGKFMAPDYIPTSPGAMFHDLDEVDHWQRFLDIQTYLNTAGNSIQQYEVSTATGAPSSELQKAMDDLRQNYSILIQQLHYNFASTNSLDLRGMQQTQTFATAVWANGGIPQWDTILPAFWPTVFNPHACQGLNECAGQGYGESGTAAGDGACATTSTHGCQDSNSCANQGGCGFAGKTKAGHKEYAPGANACKNLGGCMAPISPDQWYSNSETDNPYKGQNVWTVARQLFKTKYTTANPSKPFKDIGAVSSRRLAVTPNSPKDS